jgi:hypothetical protein
VAAASRGRLWAVAGALALGAALGGCGSSGLPSGPLGPGMDDGHECVTQLDNGIATFGWPNVRNTTHTVAVIDKVALVSPHHLQLITTWAVPITGTSLYGAVPGFPPGTTNVPGFQWGDRHTAVGATVRYTSKITEVTNLLFVIRVLGQRGYTTGVDVWYHVGTQHYLYSTPFGLIAMNGAKGSCAKY